MTSSIKYLCIDDQEAKTIDPLLNLLEKEELVSFERCTPKGLGEQIEAIRQFIASRLNEGPFGLLLDLRLDEMPDENNERAAYRGPTLAQELRTRMAEGSLPAFPIVLWSVNDKFIKSYNLDETSHDLFDGVYGKDRQITETPDSVAKELASLARGYASLKELKGKGIRHAVQTLGLTEDQDSAVYAQFLDEYKDVAKRPSSHEIAQFLLMDLLGSDGLVVTEETLAARLGIDIDASASEWQILKTYLESAKYAGPFSDGWHRWWWFRVANWWSTFLEQQTPLQRMEATDRVKVLNDKFEMGLTVADPINNSYSTNYFTLCVALKRPLDPADGLRVTRKLARSWHDTRFVSVHAALERINRENWKLDPLESARLSQIKAAMRTRKDGKGA